MQLLAGYSRGQMKIQEMAFVLVAFIVFFALVLLFYVAFRGSTLKQEAKELEESKAMELVQKLSSSPELNYAGCSKCLDFDKALVLKNEASYRNFWQIDYLRIERVYPFGNAAECTTANYPNCNSITIKSSGKDFGIPSWAFVALCRQEFIEGGYTKCELGRIYASGKAIA